MNRHLTRALAAVVLGLAAAGPAVAQVGYAPGSSPYTDVNTRTALTPFAGYMFGSGGKFLVGPHRGLAVGASYSLRANKFVEVGLSYTQFRAQREIINPFVRLVDRDVGSVNETVHLPELKFTFNVTGGKAWHHLAPYTGFGLGIAFAGRNAADTSGYNFGKKFAFTPQVGVRVFITSTIALRLQAQGTVWKLSYPTSYGLEPPLQPGTATNPNAVITDGKYKAWTLNPTLTAGLVLPIRLF